MDQKPIHYDGSMQGNYEVKDEVTNQDSFQITDEMRKFIGGNPYIIN
ncbi:hypothetical protein [Peribacillus alkalitolerans]|nr:hypothetical protein [Peribacillus alkalitolerans]